MVPCGLTVCLLTRLQTPGGRALGPLDSQGLVKCQVLIGTQLMFLNVWMNEVSGETLYARGEQQ